MNSKLDDFFYLFDVLISVSDKVIKTPKTSPKKNTLTLVELQQLPEIENMDSKSEMCGLNWTIYISRRKVCISFKTDMDKLNIVVYRYRNNRYVKDTEKELKLTKYEKLLSKRLYLLTYIDVFFKQCIVLDETIVHN